MKSKKKLKLDEKINFGFTKVEILDGNIGYIELVKCSGLVGEKVAQKIGSIMNFIEETDAVIID